MLLIKCRLYQDLAVKMLRIETIKLFTLDALRRKLPIKHWFV